MLIRAEQIEQLREGVLRETESRMVAHVKEHLPGHFKVLGESRLRLLAARALQAASGCGMYTEGSAMLFLELMVLFGSECTGDPQLPFSRCLADGSAREQARADALHREAVEYRAAVGGENGRHLLAALERLGAYPTEWRAASAQEFRASLSARLQVLYPEKSERLEAGGLEALISRAIEQAQACGLRTPAAVALLSAMMLVWGAGVLNDPRFPSFQEAVGGEAGDAPARVARLRTALDAELKRWLPSRRAANV